MRKLKLQVQMSVDGFIAGANGEMDWMTWNWDDGIKDYVGALTEPVDCILLGRVLAQGFIPHWASAATAPGSADAFARKMYDTPKIVFSNTLSIHDWPNTVLATEGLDATITGLKTQARGDIIAYGGSRFVSSLINQNLIDEYHLFVNPAAVGAGMPIFAGLAKRLALKLQHARAFDCGISVLCYRPA